MLSWFDGAVMGAVGVGVCVEGRAKGREIEGRGKVKGRDGWDIDKEVQ